MELGLAGKVALVAGASRGIGFSIAEGFAREQASVVIAARDAAPLEAARAALVEVAGADAVKAVVADMSAEEQIDRAVVEAVAAFGGLDVVVAAVGFSSLPAGLDVSNDEWEVALGSNLLPGMGLAHAVLPHLQKSRGSLIFISSIAGVEVLGAPLAYSASKAALQAAAKSLSHLVGGSGVRVNVVAPGNILFPGSVWESKLAENQSKIEGFINAEVPLQRFGTPEEIADAVVFLASERASFVTGALLVVDGGQTRSF